MEPRPRKEKLKFKKLSFPTSRKENLPIPREIPNISLAEVIEKRKTARELKQISKEDLSKLLWLAARTKYTSFSDTEFLRQHRGSPSAGGIHPIDIFIINNSTSPEVALYDSKNHALNFFDINSDKDLSNYIEDIKDMLPNADGPIIQLVGDIEKTSSSYINSESLLWRDAGCLISTIMVSAEAVGLSSCPLGIIGEKFILAIGIDQIKFLPCGVLVVGQS